MALSYLSHGSLMTYEDLCPDRSVLLFDPRTERGAAPLGDRLRRAVNGRRADCVVLRGSSGDFSEMLEEDAIAADVLRSTPVFGLGGSYETAARAPRLWQPSWTETTDSPDLRELRQAEICAILEHSGAIHRLGRFHYVLPSRSHARAFIRLADALRDPIDTVRLVDWLLEHVGEDGTVVADTGTVLALLFALRAEARQRFDIDVEIASLSEYPTDYTAMDELLADLRAHRSGHMLLVVSVSSSGRVADLFEQLSEEPHDVVVVCDTGSTGVTALARYPIERWEARADGRCDSCDQFEQLVIHPSTYQPLPVEGLKLVGFDRERAADQERFWRIADRQGAVQLHYDELVPAGPGAGRRHMAINLNLVSLLADQEFRGGVVDELSRGALPDHVLIPEHGAAKALSALAREAFPGLNPDAVHTVSGDALGGELVEALLGCGRVLVLDDALVTGSTLIHLRRAVYYSFRDRGVPPPEVHAFVVVSRPAGDDESAVRRNYAAPADTQSGLEQRFRAAESVSLPSQCPWCEEREVLNRVAARLPTHGDRLRERAQALTSMEGLSPPLLPSRDDQPEHQTYDSFLGELSPAAAFAATASVAHSQRLELDQQRRGAEVVVLNVPLVLEAFYDPVVVAGILRTVPQRLLRYQSQDAAVNERLSEHGDALGPACLSEIAWAAILDRLPREAIYCVLERTAGPPILDAFRELLLVQDSRLASTSTTAPDH